MSEGSITKPRHPGPILTATVALLAAGGVAVSTWLQRDALRPKPTPAVSLPVMPTAPDPLATDLQALRHSARAAERAARALDHPRPPTLQDPAALLIFEAERVQATDRADAVDRYRLAVELYPRSPWAAVARERLKHLSS